MPCAEVKRALTTPRMSSRIPGFYKLLPQGRLDALETHLGVDTAGFLSDGLPLETADLMVENVVSLSLIHISEPTRPY